jgi:hypothetical protein
MVAVTQRRLGAALGHSFDFCPAPIFTGSTRVVGCSRNPGGLRDQRNASARTCEGLKAVDLSRAAVEFGGDAVQVGLAEAP